MPHVALLRKIHIPLMGKNPHLIESTPFFARACSRSPLSRPHQTASAPFAGRRCGRLSLNAVGQPGAAHGPYTPRWRRLHGDCTPAQAPRPRTRPVAIARDGMRSRAGFAPVAYAPSHSAMVRIRYARRRPCDAHVGHTGAAPDDRAPGPPTAPRPVLGPRPANGGLGPIKCADYGVAAAGSAPAGGLGAVLSRPRSLAVLPGSPRCASPVWGDFDPTAAVAPPRPICSVWRGF